MMGVHDKAKPCEPRLDQSLLDAKKLLPSTQRQCHLSRRPHVRGTPQDHRSKPSASKIEIPMYVVWWMASALTLTLTTPSLPLPAALGHSHFALGSPATPGGIDSGHSLPPPAAEDPGCRRQRHSTAPLHPERPPFCQCHHAAALFCEWDVFGEDCICKQVSRILLLLELTPTTLQICSPCQSRVAVLQYGPECQEAPIAFQIRLEPY